MFVNERKADLFRLEKQRGVVEGQSANIGATAFAVSNIETQKMMVNPKEYQVFQ